MMSKQIVLHWIHEVDRKNKQRAADNLKGRLCSYIGIGLAAAAWLIILT